MPKSVTSQVRGLAARRQLRGLSEPMCPSPTRRPSILKGIAPAHGPAQEPRTRPASKDLVPVRHGRMMGVAVHLLPRCRAKIMSNDLAQTPNRPASRSSCAATRTCRTSASSPRPSAALVFDLNDFDETLPGPFEYDVKRMAASFPIAARNNGFAKSDRRAITRAAARLLPRGRSQSSPGCRCSPVWYSHLTEQDLMAAVGRRLEGPRSTKALSKAERREGGLALPARRPRRLAPATASRRCRSWAELVDGRYRIVSEPPVDHSLARDRPDVAGSRPDEMLEVFHAQFREYRKTLQFDRRQLLERYEFVDLARKVVGVGSVGTRGIHHLAAGARRAGPALPPGQRGDVLGPGGPP